MQYALMNRQRADILTKGLTAYVHEEPHEDLWLQLCNGL